MKALQILVIALLTLAASRTLIAPVQLKLALG